MLTPTTSLEAVGSIEPVKAESEPANGAGLIVPFKAESAARNSPVGSIEPVKAVLTFAVVKVPVGLGTPIS